MNYILEVMNIMYFIPKVYIFDKLLFIKCNKNLRDF